MELLRDRQPAARSGRAAQEWHHVEARGHDTTVNREQMKFTWERSQSGHISISDLTPSFVFWGFFLTAPPPPFTLTHHN